MAKKLINLTPMEYARSLLRDAAECLREVGEIRERPDGSMSYNGYGSLAIEIDEFLERPE